MPKTPPPRLVDVQAAHDACCRAIDTLNPVWAVLTTGAQRARLQRTIDALEAQRDRLSELAGELRRTQPVRAVETLTPALFNAVFDVRSEHGVRYAVDFADATDDERKGIVWWNELSKPARVAHLVYLESTGITSPTAADAWAAFKRRGGVR